MSTATYQGLLLQFTLTACEDYRWVDDLRTSLFPGRAPAHVTIFPAFSLQAREYHALIRRLDCVARQPWVNPFILECRDIRCTEDWVAIRLRDEMYRRRDRFGEIVEDLERMIPVDASFEPHLSVYQGPTKPAYIPYFDRVMTTRGLARRVARLVGEYEDDICAPLSVEVTGYELIQRGTVIASFSFDSQFESRSEAEEPPESGSEEEDTGSEDDADEVTDEEEGERECSRGHLAYGMRK